MRYTASSTTSSISFCGQQPLGARCELRAARSGEGSGRRVFEEALSGSSPQRIKKLQDGLARSGARGFWQANVEDYLRTAKSSYAHPVLVAGVCMRLGDKGCALQWLEQGYQERDDLMVQLNVDPVFVGIRMDPRFQDLVRRVGLPEGKPQK